MATYASGLFNVYKNFDNEELQITLANIVYTPRFKLGTEKWDFLIGKNIEESVLHLTNCIMGGPGAGKTYVNGGANFDAMAQDLGNGNMNASARTIGTVGNRIETTISGVAGYCAWQSGTLKGGTD